MPQTSHQSVAALPQTAVCATHCPYCSLQCGMHLEPDSSAIWKVTKRDFPTNRGGLCQKGWTSAELLTNPGRLLSPLVRDSRSAPLPPQSKRSE